jgi:hypothetical protein
VPRRRARATGFSSAPPAKAPEPQLPPLAAAAARQIPSRVQAALSELFAGGRVSASELDSLVMQKLLGSKEEVAMEAVKQLGVVDLSRVTNKSGFLSSIIKRVDMERLSVRAHPPRPCALLTPLPPERASGPAAALEPLSRRAAAARAAPVARAGDRRLGRHRAAA